MRRLAVLAAVALLLAGCASRSAPTGCEITGPRTLLPQRVEAVRTGISRSELEALLGAADYSPADGVFYFSTGADCPLDDAGRLASCGLVAEFDRQTGEDGSVLVVDTLRRCSWGAIGE